MPGTKGYIKYWICTKLPRNLFKYFKEKLEIAFMKITFYTYT